MKITKITIRSTASTNALITPTVELSADLAEGDDFEACAQELRLQVEAELAKHVAMIEELALVTRKLKEQEENEARLTPHPGPGERYVATAAYFNAGALKPGSIVQVPTDDPSNFWARSVWAKFTGK